MHQNICWTAFMNSSSFFRMLPIAALLAFANAAQADPLLTTEMVDKLWDTYHEGSPGTENLTLRIQISASILVSSTFSITSKGNGTLAIPGANIRVYDAHGDETKIEGSLLNNSLVDIDLDGNKDLVVWGTVILFDEDGKELARRPVTSVFWFNPKTHKFVNTAPSEYVYVY